MLLPFLHRSNTEDILFILDRYLYTLILKNSMDRDATKLSWYTHPAFNSLFS